MENDNRPVTNPQELGKVVKKEPDEIIVEGDLANNVYKIKATGKVAWVIAFGAVAVAVIAVLTLPAGAAGPAGLIADGVIAGVAATTAAASIGVLGISATIAAIGIGVGARNANALNSY